MRYNTIIPNDVVNGEGVCVSFFVQGCPHRCHGCFNKETWDFFEGQEYTSNLKWEIIKLIAANGVQRNFSVLGGEPLCKPNLQMTEEVLETVRAAYPNINIYLWTGYTLEELEQQNSNQLEKIFSFIDYLIDGPFIEDQKDLSLKLRGSRNQHIWKRIEGRWDLIE